MYKGTLHNYISNILTLIAKDSNTGVVSAALLSGIQLFSKHEEMVRSWASRVT